jgi:hypothetical protein
MPLTVDEETWMKPRSADSPHASARPHELLDELLPLAEPAGLEIHAHAALLEVASPAQLLEMVSDSALRPLLLCRLAPNVVLVDPGRADELSEVLRRRGHTPKVLRS